MVGRDVEHESGYAHLISMCIIGYVILIIRLIEYALRRLADVILIDHT